MENYNAEKVKVTVNLTAEAAQLLYQYAGERNRGRFLSDLIMNQRRIDDAERARIRAETPPPSASRHLGGHPKKNKGRK